MQMLNLWRKPMKQCEIGHVDSIVPGMTDQKGLGRQKGTGCFSFSVVECVRAVDRHTREFGYASGILLHVTPWVSLGRSMRLFDCV
jgi:hypothetical protein